MNRKEKRFRRRLDFTLPYEDFLAVVKEYSWTLCSEDQLHVELRQLRERMRYPLKQIMPSALPENSFENLSENGDSQAMQDIRKAFNEQSRSFADDSAKLYSLVKEVIRRNTGLTLFDTQLCAARSMELGRIAELPTGEGKTLSAVVTAVALAYRGLPVHILVFNDYLADRDYQANAEVYRFCGLTSAVICQESGAAQRRSGYGSDVLYIPAKEAGYDYLRNFLCMDAGELQQQRLGAALVDEADSILIDEAAIPLVLAGSEKVSRLSVKKAWEAVCLLEEEDVFVDKRENQAALEPSGAEKTERFYGIANLYEEENLSLLAEVSAALEARFLYQRDVDYVVKGGKVFIVDHTTGRIASGRKFPDLVQLAVEAKEAVLAEMETIILNTTTIQFFLKEYVLLCGMTGTAKSAEKELQNMYGLPVDVIGPHTPCIRIDHPDCVYLREAEKRLAIPAAVVEAHGKGQPVLLAAGSVEESELYSKILTQSGIPHSVLNAKNDEEEAKLIARAGEPYRVTISTNMAGRGVDIRLGLAGDFDGSSRDIVEAAGGLFVISTTVNESIRIDNQLRGRAGRQGDPGESCFFVSLEDPIMRGSGGEESGGEATDDGQSDRDEPDSGSLEGEGDSGERGGMLRLDLRRQKRLRKLVRQVQRREEGKMAGARYSLERFSFLLNQQRQLLSNERREILLDRKRTDYLQSEEPELYQKLVRQAGESAVILAEKQLVLHFINRRFADYLATMDNVRNSVHLSVIGGEDPLTVYHKRAIAAYEEMAADIRSDVISSMKEVTITEAGVDLEEEGLAGATSTWTYMIDERYNQFSRLPAIVQSLSNEMKGTLFTLRDLVQGAGDLLQSVSNKVRRK